MHLIQTAVDMPAAIRHCRMVGLPATLLRDENAVAKTVLTECFSGPVVRPWAVIAKHAVAMTIVGYSAHTASELTQRRALAMPSLQQAVAEPIGCPMPEFEVGQRLAFQTRIVPTMHVRNGDKTLTRDAFLVAVERSADGMADRSEVYAAYLRERMVGAAIEEVMLSNFRLARVTRRHSGSGSGWREHTAPVAELVGVLDVTDPDQFRAFIAAGTGRQRAYGYGFLRLSPTG
jgi:hypothetical protein